MARLRNAKGRADGNSGYNRIFGDDQLGRLISRVQATVISAGSELEHLIADAVQPIPNLDTFLKQDIWAEGVFLAKKRDIKLSKILNTAGAEPDFVIFKRRSNQQRCHVIELKDGDAFDTKKAAGERMSMHSFVEKNGSHIPSIVSIHFVAFNQTSREAIRDGFKRKISLEECMTGRAFCELIEVDYEEIVKQRQSDGEDNFEYFLTSLLQIGTVQDFLERQGWRTGPIG